MVSKVNHHNEYNNNEEDYLQFVKDKFSKIVDSKWSDRTNRITKSNTLSSAKWKRSRSKDRT